MEWFYWRVFGVDMWRLITRKFDWPGSGEGNIIGLSQDAVADA